MHTLGAWSAGHARVHRQRADPLSRRPGRAADALPELPSVPDERQGARCRGDRGGVRGALPRAAAGHGRRPGEPDHQHRGEQPPGRAGLHQHVQPPGQLQPRDHRRRRLGRALDGAAGRPHRGRRRGRGPGARMRRRGRGEDPRRVEGERRHGGRRRRRRRGLPHPGRQPTFATTSTRTSSPSTRPCAARPSEGSHLPGPGLRRRPRHDAHPRARVRGSPGAGPQPPSPRVGRGRRDRDRGRRARTAVGPRGPHGRRPDRARPGSRRRPGTPGGRAHPRAAGRVDRLLHGRRAAGLLPDPRSGPPRRRPGPAGRALRPRHRGRHRRHRRPRRDAQGRHRPAGPHRRRTTGDGSRRDRASAYRRADHHPHPRAVAQRPRPARVLRRARRRAATAW